MSARQAPILLDPVEPRERADARPAFAAGALLVPLARRWRTVLLAMLAGAGLGFGAGVVQPNTYRSEGKLLVRWGEREEVSPEAAIAGRGGSGRAQPRDIVNNELQLLRDPLMFERAARTVTPQRISAPYDPAKGDDARTPLHKRLLHQVQGWWFERASDRVASKSGHSIDGCGACVATAAEALRRDALLEGVAFSNVIAVSYAAHDPALAADVVRALLGSAEEHHREVYSTDPTLEFLSVRVVESRTEMEEAERAFAEFRQASGITDQEAHRQELFETVRRLEQQEAEDASTLADLGSRTASVVELLGQVPETLVQQVERSPVVNPKWTVLQQLVLNLQNALDDLNTQVGGTTAARKAEQQRIEKRMQIALAELARQPELIDRKTAEQIVANPRYERLRQQHDDLKLAAAAHESASELRAARLDRARQELKAAEAAGPRHRELEARAREARSRFEEFEEARRRTVLMSTLDQSEYSNLRRIQDATVPMEKEGPRRGKLAFVGLVLGTLLGIAAAFAGHAFDPYVRSPGEVERLFGLRVLAVVPEARRAMPPPRVIRAAAL